MLLRILPKSQAETAKIELPIKIMRIIVCSFPKPKNNRLKKGCNTSESLTAPTLNIQYCISRDIRSNMPRNHIFHWQLNLRFKDSSCSAISNWQRKLWTQATDIRIIKIICNP